MERILWIDAICINQNDKTGEKEQQIQSMAKIYSKASRVIIWLGKATANSDRAIEAIRSAAAAKAEETESPGMDEASGRAIIALLEREWFQRIWVLQEVAAARSILIICGRAEIDGYVFSSGLSVPTPFDTRPDLQALIPPVLYLIRGAIFRRERSGDEVAQSARFSLNMHTLPELVDMYHTRKASIKHDKVFALSGMSTDDPDTAGLGANYTISWKDLFRNLIQFSLSKQTTIYTWEDEEVAAVEAKGYVLGEVSSARRGDRQHVDIDWKHAPSYFDKDEFGKQKSHFTFQTSGKTIEERDIVCLFQGASRPTIIRLRDGYSTIVMSSMPLTDNLQKWSASVKRFPNDVLVIWDWDESRRKSQRREDYEKLLSSRDIPRCSVPECQCLDDLEQVGRLMHFALFLDGIGRFEDAVRNIRKAVMIHRTKKGERNDDEAYICQGSCSGAENVMIRLIESLSIHSEGADMKTKNIERQTLLSWAARSGYKATVPLLIEKGACIKASRSWKPLLWAAEEGDETTMRLLIERGASVKAKIYRYIPLARAASRGHEAIVRLLIDNGTEIEDLVGREMTPLHLAAAGGHEAVVRILIDYGAQIDKRNLKGKTPLDIAAERGHKAIVQLLKSRLTPL